MDSKCTWENCTVTSALDQIATDGDVWARLCQEHRDKFEASLKSQDNRIIVADWIRAQGGARAAARRLSGGRK